MTLNIAFEENECAHENLRIMHVVNFFDPRLGYAEYYIAKKQIESGFDLCVVSSDYPLYGKQRWPSGMKKVDGIIVLYIRGLFKFRGNIFVFDPFRLRRIIKDFSPDIIHCHGLLSPLSQEILVLKSSSKYKVVGDLITGVSPLTSTLLPSLRPLLNLWLLRRTDAFFACNKAIERFLVETLKISPSKTHFVPLGADVDLFRPDQNIREKTRNLLGFLSKDVVAIYTGKFQPSKRIHDFLKASKAVIDRNSDFKVILVGEGEPFYQEKLRLLVDRLGIDTNILFVKTVHRKRLSYFYNAADFAVWPGSFSISIVEAMACGLPTIIAESDWTSHYLENDNGFSFKAGDTHTLSSLILRLIQEPDLREQMGRLSRELVMERLNWRTIAGRYAQVYESVLASKTLLACNHKV